MRTGLAKKGRPAASWWASLVLLALVGVFCGATRWGRTYYQTLRSARGMWLTTQKTTAFERWTLLYGDPFPFFVHIVDHTPPDAVILFPPRLAIDDSNPSIGIARSESALYSFLYPRIPVHEGEDHPNADRMTHVTIYDHGGLDRFEANVKPTPANRFGIAPYREGMGP